jgi:hypothetical protein
VKNDRTVMLMNRHAVTLRQGYPMSACVVRSTPTSSPYNDNSFLIYLVHHLCLLGSDLLTLFVQTAKDFGRFVHSHLIISPSSTHALPQLCNARPHYCCHGRRSTWPIRGRADRQFPSSSPSCSALLRCSLVSASTRGAALPMDLAQTTC